jgi:hypothetical protein
LLGGVFRLSAHMSISNVDISGLVPNQKCNCQLVDETDT